MSVCENVQTNVGQATRHDGTPHYMVKADLTGFMEDFSRLLLNSFSAALKFILGVLELHYPDFPILDRLL